MLLHIHRIEYCEAYHLASTIVLPETASVLLREPMPWREVPMVGLATLETSEEVKKGVRTHSAKLTATFCGGRLALPSHPLVYRLTCVNGWQYLMGTAEPPFPLTTQEDNRPRNEAETSAVSLVVSQHSYVPLLLILPK